MLTLSKTDKTINDDNYDNKLHLSGELWVFYRGRFSQFFFKGKREFIISKGYLYFIIFIWFLFLLY